MAIKLQYLTDPLIGYQTKSGSLNTAGIIRVYDAATDDPVVTYKDFAGTANAQDIRLDDNGRAVIIADDSRAYRVEVCDRYGALLYTQTPLYAKGGGGGVMTGVNVISSDETVKVETTTEGGIKTFDLSVDKDDPEYIVCDSCYVKGYGNAGCGYIVPDHKVEGNMSLTSDGILLKAGGHYHVDAWIDAVADGENGDPSNEYRQREMKLNFRLGSADATPVNMVFDNSYAHADTYNLSGDIHPVTDTYLKVYYDNYEWADYQSGYILSSHLQMPRINVHSIVGSYNGGGGGGGGGGDYQAGEGINITGDTISVDQSVIQHKLVAGDNVTINNVTNTISVDLSGKADKVDGATSGNLAGLDSNGNLTDSGIAASDVATQSDLSGKQDTLTTGPNVDIINNIISTEKTVVAAGQNVSVTSSLDSLTRTVTYTVSSSGGTFEQVQSDWTEDDTEDPAYIKHRPTQKTIAAGDGILISENASNVTITANPTNADWTEDDPTDAGYIKHRPTTSNLYAGSGITISESGGYTVIAAQNPSDRIQSDWDQSNPSAPSYIQNRPTEKTLVAGNGISITETVSSVTIEATAPSTGTVPTVTSSDDGKMLQASYDSLTGVGSYAWETVNIPAVGTVVV